jgi:hypothetical protein
MLRFSPCSTDLFTFSELLFFLYFFFFPFTLMTLGCVTLTKPVSTEWFLFNYWKLFCELSPFQIVITKMSSFSSPSYTTMRRSKSARKEQFLICTLASVSYLLILFQPRRKGCIYWPKSFVIDDFSYSTYYSLGQVSISSYLPYNRWNIPLHSQFPP